MMKLKSTGETVFHVGWLGTEKQPWPADYRRVMIVGKNGNRLQIVHHTKITDN